ncbi:MAG TPA: hypothetical protein DDZ68_17145 [Parvularcula sp.]|nr:hypothetical protein [Parvularcula sp.]HBS32552.1 hypothetical protein [Parvularcula sp.]HBS33914.1 hypothetical protein [Parvularcula sp.]
MSNFFAIAAIFLALAEPAAPVDKALVKAGPPREVTGFVAGEVALYDSSMKRVRSVPPTALVGVKSARKHEKLPFYAITLDGVSYWVIESALTFKDAPRTDAVPCAKVAGAIPVGEGSTMGNNTKQCVAAPAEGAVKPK